MSSVAATMFQCPDCYGQFPGGVTHPCPIGELKRRVHLLETVVLEMADRGEGADR